MEFRLILLVIICVVTGTGCQRFDYVVVGGGTAGCVVASRLSEDPDVEVLLLEAGPSNRDIPQISIPALAGGLIGGELDWGYLSQPLQKAGQELKNKRARMSTARVLGGSSSHNGMNIVRGNLKDYNRWEKMGNRGWGYKDVLPFFKMYEDMQVSDLIANGFHGVGGPVPIVHEQGGKLLRTFLDAGIELGYNVTDHNSDKQLGFSINQINSKLGRRVSMSEAYIWPVSGRRNLKVVLNALVTKIKIRASKAVGVDYVSGEKKFFVKGRKDIILSAGALNSPKLLMLSGIGPRYHLTEMKIPVIKDLPVGNELKDHMWTYLAYSVNESISFMPEDFQSFDNLLNFVLNGEGPFASTAFFGFAFFQAGSQRNKDKFPFLQCSFMSGLIGVSEEEQAGFGQSLNINKKFLNPLHAAERGLHGYVLSLLHLHQRRFGKVRLKDKHIHSDLKLYLPMLEDATDLADLIDAVRFGQSLAKTSAFQSIGAYYTFPPHPACTHLTFDTDAYWACHLTYKSYSAMHYMGTCKMSPDKTGVVDRKLRVWGIKNLRVVDASIIPHAVSGNTMAATIMIAEKAAHMIRQAKKKD